GSHIDISSRKAVEDEIRYLAFYDFLTGLPNRRLLMDRLRYALNSSYRHGKRGALLFIDMDNFKNLNDTLGHDMGDLLLQQVAERLISSVRETDTVSRLGGDEFIVMLENLSEQILEATAEVEAIGDKILAILNQNYQLRIHDYHSTPSIGVTLFNGHEKDVNMIIKQADTAMYEAKRAGRNTLRFYDSSNLG
ncbi:MAG: GGDEF domain-containing protein, partial [Methylococcales bacterium]|nr:GGDEF domain-containing protein [Methylococcales bacterium]